MTGQPSAQASKLPGGDQDGCL